MPTADKNIEALIGTILRNASLLQTRVFSGSETLEIGEMDEDFQLGQVVSRQMTLIVIAGPKMSIQFKIHFNRSEADKLRQIKFHQSVNEESTTSAKTMDYIKELTNQVCGRICRVFELNGQSLGMSIPLSMRGFYELYTHYDHHVGTFSKFGQAWRLNGDFGSLVCTAYVEITDTSVTSELKHLDELPTNDDDDELEFL